MANKIWFTEKSTCDGDQVYEMSNLVRWLIHNIACWSEKDVITMDHNYLELRVNIASIGAPVRTNTSHRVDDQHRKAVSYKKTIYKECVWGWVGWGVGRNLGRWPLSSIAAWRPEKDLDHNYLDLTTVNISLRASLSTNMTHAASHSSVNTVILIKQSTWSLLIDNLWGDTSGLIKWVC